MVGSLTSGAIWSLAPIYAEDLGLLLTEVAAFVSMAILGGASVRCPLGRLSDRLNDQRWLSSAVCTVATVAGQLLIAAVSRPVLVIYVPCFLFGAAAFSLYGMCLAYASDQAEATDFVEISAGCCCLRLAPSPGH